MRQLFVAGLAGAMLAAGAAAAQENGWGADPDRDGNPAVNTRAMYKIGSAAEAALDPPYRVITFEAGKHGEAIGAQYAREFGVTFGQGLSRQACEGQRYFLYDSQCTYKRAPSGKYAAVYRDDWQRPLVIDFANPVCAAALAIYPTGGKEGEDFRVRIQPYTADGRKLDRTSVRFEWTQDTFRWRLMAGAYMLQDRASRIEVTVESLRRYKKPRRDRDDRADGDDDGFLSVSERRRRYHEPRRNVRFLIDDVAFVEEGCGEMLAEISDTAASSSDADARSPRDRRYDDDYEYEGVDFVGE